MRVMFWHGRTRMATGTEVQFDEARVHSIEELASEGPWRVASALGGFRQRQGTFSDPDLIAAADYYRALLPRVALTSRGSILSAAESWILGEYQQAIDAYEVGDCRGMLLGRALQFARAHFLGEFGPLVGSRIRRE